MGNNKDLISHCKKCHGVILREIETKKMKGAISFKIRCPHCSEDVFVSIDIVYDHVIKVE